MAARNDEGQERRFQFGMAEEIGKDMAFHVVDTDQGLSAAKLMALAAATPTSRAPTRPGP